MENTNYDMGWGELLFWTAVLKSIHSPTLIGLNRARGGGKLSTAALHKELAETAATKPAMHRKLLGALQVPKGRPWMYREREVVAW